MQGRGVVSDLPYVLIKLFTNHVKISELIQKSDLNQKKHSLQASFTSCIAWILVAQYISIIMLKSIQQSSMILQSILLTQS